MEPEFIKSLATLGIGGVLAGMMFWFYQKAEARNAACLKELAEKHTADVKEQSVRHEAQLAGHNGFLRDLMITTNAVIRENTASNTQLIAVINGLQAGNAQLMVLFRRRGVEDERQ